MLARTTQYTRAIDDPVTLKSGRLWFRAFALVKLLPRSIARQSVGPRSQSTISGLASPICVEAPLSENRNDSTSIKGIEYPAYLTGCQRENRRWMITVAKYVSVVISRRDSIAISLSRLLGRHRQFSEPSPYLARNFLPRSRWLSATSSTHFRAMVRRPMACSY